MKSETKQIKDAIKAYYRMFEPETIIDGIGLIRHVKKVIGRRDCYPDTILRAMRQLRQDKVINYVSVGQNKESKYRIINL